jgi:pimeloyl-ACP methyl ester carboxylesterase
MELLTDDALALLDALGLGAVHFVGLSMGGFVGMRIAARWPHRIQSLALLDTSSSPEPRENLPKYKLLTIVAESLGVRLVSGAIMPILFGRTTMRAPERAAARAGFEEKMRANRPTVARAVRGVLEREGVEHLLARIAAPTLVLVGDEDVATPIERARAIAAGIRGAELAVIPGAGHSATVEAPRLVNEALDAFYRRIEG